MNKKNRPEIVVRASLSLDYLCVLFGSDEASLRYNSLCEDLRMMESDNTPNSQSLGDILKSAIALREQILEENETRVIPLTVHRIDVYLKNKPLTELISLQLSSCYRIPIFIDKTLIVSNDELTQLSSLLPKCSWEPINVHGVDGFVLEHKRRSQEIVEESTSGCTVHITKRILVVATSRKRLFKEEDTHSIYDRDEFTYYYGITKKAAVAFLAEKHEKKTCIVHICNDFVVSDSTPHGRGVNFCRRTLESLPRGCFFTECVANLLKLNKAEYAVGGGGERGLLYQTPIVAKVDKK